MSETETETEIAGHTKKGLNIKPPYIDTKDVDLTKGFPAYDRHPDSDLPPKIKRRLQEREDWDYYWKLRRVYVSENWAYWPSYLLTRYLFDAPVTWFREKIVEPLHDRYKRPYYHRRFNRPPGIDQCGVNDRGCQYEAAEQFRMDKMVDRQILMIMANRVGDCYRHNSPHQSKIFNAEPCINLIDAWQEAELNWFIKYGEIGAGGDVMDAYMKQKHRMIWERRHPEIMEERQKRFELHKQRVASGDLDYDFYKKGLYWQDKKKYAGIHEPIYQKVPFLPDQPISRDWTYYQKKAQDPEFDKHGGTVATPINMYGQGIFGIPKWDKKKDAEKRDVDNNEE